MFIFEYVIMLAIICLMIFFLVQFYNIVFRGYAPFIPSRSAAMKKVVDALDIKADGTIYELGSGSASFLRLARQKYPQAKLIGIEYSIMPYAIAQIQNSLSHSKIKFMKKNFFKVDLSDADVIYCFLNMKTMQDLEPKLAKECKPGALLISYYFSLPGHTPVNVVENKHHDKMLFYRF